MVVRDSVACASAPSGTTGVPGTAVPSTTNTTAIITTSSTALETTTTSAGTSLDPRVEAVIDVGNLPRGLAFFADSVWVANARSSSVSRIDPSTNTRLADISTGPTPVTLTVLGDDLWVSVVGGIQGNAGQNAFELIDAESNKVGSSWPVPIFHNTAAGGGYLWAFDSRASIQAVDPLTGEIAATVEVGSVVQTIAADETAVWGVRATGTVWKLDMNSMEIIAEFELDDHVPGRSRIAIVPGGVAISYEGVLALVDEASATVEIHDMDGLMNVNELVYANNALWLSGTLDGSGVLLAIDLSSSEVVDTYVLGPEPAGVAFGDGSIWVGDQVEGVVYRLRR